MTLRERIVMSLSDPLLLRTRRHFFRECAVGVGSMALASLLHADTVPTLGPRAPGSDPLAPRPGHFPAKAKNVIFLFMCGGPSQLELFDHKPRLNELHGKTIPEALIQG